MKPQDSSEESFASRLERYDKEAVAGRDFVDRTDADPSEKEGDPSRLDKVKPILHLLETMFPRVPEEEAFLPTPQRFPTQFGRFKINKELGRGGFGIVFEAFDPVLGRDVALKVPRPEVMASASLARRFFQEARTSARLRHPNIIPVHEAGEIPPTYFIVSELGGGPNLAEWLAGRAQPLTADFAVRIVAILAEAVAHAQSMKILHRDIKPSNVILSLPQSQWEISPDSDSAVLGFVPKLTDFGLAKLLEEPSIAGHEPIVGTRKYAAPEQMAGRSAEIGAATDVYSLGALLHELLVGFPPVRGAGKPRSDQRGLSTITMELKKRRPEVPRDLIAILEKALAEEPKKRYADAALLARDLRHYLARMPVSARPKSIPHRFWGRLRRHPLESMMVGMVVLLAVVVSAGSWLLGRTIESETKAADAAHLVEEERENSELQFERMGDLEYVADVRAAQNARDNADPEQCLAKLAPYVPATTTEKDRRGYEWFRLYYLCHGEELRIEDFSGDVYSVVFTPDGQRLLTACANGQVSVIDRETGKRTRFQPAHRAEVDHVAVSSDGRWIVSTADDGGVFVRDGDGNLIHRLSEHRGKAQAVGLHVAQPWGVTGDSEGELIWWDWDSGQRMGSWEFNGEPIEAVGVGPTGTPIVVSLSNGEIWTIAEWNRDESPTLLWRLDDQGIAIAFVPETGDAVVAGRDGQVTLFDLSQRTVRKQWQAHEDWINDIAVSPSSEWCVTVSRDRTARVWDLADGGRPVRVIGHQGRLWGVAVSPDGESFATAGGDAAVRVWNKRTCGEDPVLADFSSDVMSIQAVDEERIVVACRDGLITQWDLPSGQERRRWNLPDGLTDLRVAPVADHEDRYLLVACQPHGSVLIWSSDEEARKAKTFRFGNPHSLAIEPKLQEVAVAHDGGQVSFIRLSDDSIRGPFPVHRGNARLCYSPRGARLVSVGMDSMTTIHDASTMQQTLSMEHHRKHVLDAAFSPNGNLLATVGGDNMVALASCADGKLIASLHGHTEETVDVEYSSDGKTIIAGYRDGFVRMWNTETLQEVYAAQTRIDQLHTMLLLPDRHYLLLAGRERATGRSVVVVWRAATPAEVEE